jgi:hypothetical protein
MSPNGEARPDFLSASRGNMERCGMPLLFLRSLWTNAIEAVSPKRAFRFCARLCYAGESQRGRFSSAGAPL